MQVRFSESLCGRSSRFLGRFEMTIRWNREVYTVCVERLILLFFSTCNVFPKFQRRRFGNRRKSAWDVWLVKRVTSHMSSPRLLSKSSMRWSVIKWAALRDRSPWDLQAVYYNYWNSFYRGFLHEDSVRWSLLHCLVDGCSSWSCSASNRLMIRL